MPTPTTAIGARAGALEQLLRVLALLGMSQAYSNTLEAVVANMNPAPTLNPFRDPTVGLNMAGYTFPIDLTDTEFGVAPSAWMGMEKAVPRKPGFAKVQLTENLRLLPPWPILELMGVPGVGHGLNEAGVKEWEYAVDAIVITQNDKDPNAAQREALVMIDAFEQLIYANQQLGGLCARIDAPSPPQPGGSGSVKGAGVLAAAMVRFHIDGLRASGLS